MRRNTLLYFLVIFTSVIVCAPFLHAQDPATSQEQGEYDLIIEEALDQVEVNVDQVPSDETLTELTISEDAEIEIDVDIPNEVEVLEDIVIDEDNRLQESDNLETKIIPLLHAEASSIIDALNRIKSPKGEVMYNKEDSTLVLKDVSEQLEEMNAYVKEVDILLETKIFRLEYAKAEDIIPFSRHPDLDSLILENFLKSFGNIQNDLFFMLSKTSDGTRIFSAVARINNDLADLRDSISFACYRPLTEATDNFRLKIDRNNNRTSNNTDWST